MADGSAYLTTAPRVPARPPDAGLAYEAVAADAFARSRRLSGLDARLVLTTVDHGRGVQRAAFERGGTPADLADQWADGWQAMLQALDVAPDQVVRTTDMGHQRVVKALFLKLFDQGHIHKARHRGPYCERCEAFADPGDACPSCGGPLAETAREVYLLRASAFAKPLVKHLEEHRDLIRPSTLHEEALRVLAEAGVPDVPISRPAGEWAIAVPIDPEQAIDDAFMGLVGYLTGGGYLADPQLFERTWPPALQFLPASQLHGHAVVLPALLLAAGVQWPEHLVVRGRVALDGGLAGLTERLGAQAVRYGLLRLASPTADTAIEPGELVERCNADLADRLAHLVGLTLAAIAEARGGRVPRGGALGDAEEQVAVPARELLATTSRLAGELDFAGALDRVLTLADRALDYARSAGIGPDATVPAEGRRLDTALYVLAETCRLIALSLRPFLPRAAAGIEGRLGLDYQGMTLAELPRWGLTQPDAPVQLADPLFRRIAPSAP